MTIPAPASCPHELRPGTTRCLHCRSEARAAARARLRRSAARIGLASVVVAIVALVVNAGSTVLTMGDALPAPEGPGVASRAPSVAATQPAPQAGATAPTAVPHAAAAPVATPVVTVASRQGPPTYAARDVAPSPAPSAAPAPAAPAPRAAPVAGAPRPVLPRVAEGRTELRDSMFVVRSGDGVVLHFDTGDLRTRRAEKFEQIVRSTLPRLYGPSVDSVLATIPVGQLVVGADLLTELPQRGVFIRVADGATIGVWPETRPGRDGPLVVNYRATLTR